MNKTIATLKHELRQECKRIRAALTETDRRTASHKVCQHIEDWKHFQAAATVLTYLPIKSEVDLTPLLARQPQKQWAIPRIRPGGQMDFHAYDPSRLILHKFGMLEPAQDCPIIPADEIQLALVPGLAFDQSGWRLGYGGGFYDRFLSVYPGHFVGITYQVLVLDQVPHGEYDIPMAYIVTENGLFASTQVFGRVR